MEYPVPKETVNLEYPRTFNGKEYKTLELRRPLVKDQLIADKQNKDPADKEIHFMALLAEVDVEVIQMLDLDDYEAVQKKITGFRKKNVKNSQS